MKTWVWVLLVVAAVSLFLWSARHEGFQPTATLKGPPYGNTDHPLIVGMMSPALVTALQTKNNTGPMPTEPGVESTPGDRASYEVELAAYQKKLVDGIISSAMGEFYSTVYQPATVSVTSAKVDTFMTTYLAQIKTTTPSAHTFLSANKADVSALLVAYFVTQPAGAANLALTTAQTTSANASTASGYAALLAAMGQGPAPNPSCPTGYTTSADFKTCNGATGSAPKTPTCPTPFTFTNGVCKPPSTVGGTGGTGGATGGTGNTTGGSSLTPEPNSGTNNGNIWGPAFTGFGNNASSGAAGSRDYPTLIGPGPSVSTYVEGAGILSPSQNQTLGRSGALPSGAGLGSDPNSRFFGSSRTPGDRDLIPDSNQEFTPSIGSSKTEPVPYLADFSAFAN
jgi:hypothetical protein